MSLLALSWICNRFDNFSQVLKNNTYLLDFDTFTTTYFRIDNFQRYLNCLNPIYNIHGTILYHCVSFNTFFSEHSLEHSKRRLIGCGDCSISKSSPLGRILLNSAHETEILRKSTDMFQIVLYGHERSRKQKYIQNIKNKNYKNKVTK